MFVICLIISYKYTNKTSISQLFSKLFYPELTLIVKHGFEWYGIFWVLIENLYQNANALQPECDTNAIKESKVKGNNNSKSKSLFNLKKALLDYGFQEELVEEWLSIRKNKRSVNSEFAYNSFIAQVERSRVEKTECKEVACK